MGNDQSGIQVPEFLRHKLALKPEIPRAKFWREDICPFLYRLLDYAFLHTIPEDKVDEIIKETNTYHTDMSFLKTHCKQKNTEHSQKLREILYQVSSELKRVIKRFDGITRTERNVNDQIWYIRNALFNFIEEHSYFDSSHYSLVNSHNFGTIEELEMFLEKLGPILLHRQAVSEFFDKIQWHPPKRVCSIFLDEETYTDRKIIEAIDFIDPALAEMRDTFILAEFRDTDGDTSGFDPNGCMDFMINMKVRRFLRGRNMTLTEFICDWDECQDLDSIGRYARYGFEYFLAHFNDDYWPTVPHFHEWLQQSHFAFRGRVVDEKLVY